MPNVMQSQSDSPGSTFGHRGPYFFKNPTFEMIFLTAIGRAYHSGGNVENYVQSLTTSVSVIAGYVNYSDSAH